MTWTDDNQSNEMLLRGGGPQQPQLCHIRVQFAYPSLEFDYHDDRAVAHRFAAVACRVGMAVTIDDDLSGSWPCLPCRRLWA